MAVCACVAVCILAEHDGCTVYCGRAESKLLRDTKYEIVGLFHFPYYTLVGLFYVPYNTSVGLFSFPYDTLVEQDAGCVMSFVNAFILRSLWELLLFSLPVPTM